MAADPGSPLHVRLYGLRILYSQANRGALVTAGWLTAEPVVIDSTETAVVERIQAPGSSFNDEGYLYGTDVPAEEWARIELTLSRLISGSNSPSPVQRAAERVLAAVQNRRR
jgi:hypothetical protein